MSLNGYVAPSATITVESAEGPMKIAIRGLSADAISALVQAQGDVMREVYGRALNGEFDEADVETLLVTLLDEAPLLVALTIAYGTGDMTAYPQAMTMPFADQVAITDAIVQLTFQREGGAKKVMEIVRLAATKLLKSGTGLTSKTG